jgi:hypothetical protein
MTHLHTLCHLFRKIRHEIQGFIRVEIPSVNWDYQGKYTPHPKVLPIPVTAVLYLHVPFHYRLTAITKIVTDQTRNAMAAAGRDGIKLVLSEQLSKSMWKQAQKAWSNCDQHLLKLGLSLTDLSPAGIDLDAHFVDRVATVFHIGASVRPISLVCFTPPPSHPLYFKPPTLPHPPLHPLLALCMFGASLSVT